VAIQPGTGTDAEAEIVFGVRPPEPVERDMRRLRSLTDDPTPTLILCDNAGQAERLEELLSEHGPVGAGLAVGVLGGGFVIPSGASGMGGLRVLTDHEIFRRDRRIRRQ